MEGGERNGEGETLIKMKPYQWEFVEILERSKEAVGEGKEKKENHWLLFIIGLKQAKWNFKRSLLRAQNKKMKYFMKLWVIFYALRRNLSK